MFRRRRHMTVASSVSILLILGGLVGCSNGQPAGYAHFDPGSHTIMINGSHYPLKLPGRADLKVDGSAVLPADLGVDAAVRGSDASRDGIYRSEDGNEQFYYVLTDRFANGDEKTIPVDTARLHKNRGLIRRTRIFISVAIFPG